MKRLLCFLFGHKPIFEWYGEIGERYKGPCMRCGKAWPVDNAISRCKKELSELARRMEARRKERGDD